MGSFNGVSAQSYRAFMGRFSTPLAVQFATLGLEGVDADARLLDVGCGPGMLTIELARRRGAHVLSAVDPEPEFVAATAEACPGADVRVASAEELPYGDGRFGAVLAQLVVHFMTDPARGVSEMARVAVPGGRVAACVWDHGGGRGPLSTFWRVARRLDGRVQGESGMKGVADGQLVEIFRSAGLRDVVQSDLEVEVEFTSFEDWWTPFLHGVGPAGRYVATLDPGAVARLETALRGELENGPFTMAASAWAAAGTAA